MTENDFNVVGIVIFIIVIVKRELIDFSKVVINGIILVVIASKRRSLSD